MCVFLYLFVDERGKNCIWVDYVNDYCEVESRVNNGLFIGVFVNVSWGKGD